MAKESLFTTHLDELISNHGRYDDAGYESRKKCLRTLHSLPLPKNNDLIRYHTALLYLCAYPDSNETTSVVSKEFNRIAAFIKREKLSASDIVIDSGLPYAYMQTRYSYEAFKFLQKNKSIRLELHSLNNEAFDVKAFLNLVAPRIMSEEIIGDLNNQQLFHLFGVEKSKDAIAFILSQMDTIQASGLMKEQLWQQLKAFVSISSADKYFSKSFNKLSFATCFLHKDLIKKFDFNALVLTALPSQKRLNHTQKNELVMVIKNSMLLSLRETDPATYMDESSLQYFELDRGISVAIYGMKAERQLPLHAYIGYSLFKNGYPISYGGSWVFGHGAKFGMNVLDEYRGGESGYIMGQILRVYIQVFKLSFIEVDAYMFGLNNEEGVDTAAYWFYYKWGFRSLDKKFRKLADDEYVKIKQKPASKSSKKTLKAFTQSNVALFINHKTPVKINDIANPILSMIAKEFKGLGKNAIDVSIKELYHKIADFTKKKYTHNAVLEEVALWIKAFNITDSKKLRVAIHIIEGKAKSAELHNELIKQMID